MLVIVMIEMMMNFVFHDEFNVRNVTEKQQIILLGSHWVKGPSKVIMQFMNSP